MNSLSIRELFLKASSWAHGYYQEFSIKDLDSHPHAILYRARAVRQFMDEAIARATETLQIEYDSLDFPEAIEFHKGRVETLTSILTHDEEDESLLVEIETHKKHIRTLEERGTTGYKVDE